ncbi:MAG: type III-B CRISPR module-associated protein Cmr5 [Firmicutes bacterium]|nr:type III-B CRISPR module-associated protein Cmr5 [Bacillota bacterium]
MAKASSLERSAEQNRAKFALDQIKKYQETKDSSWQSNYQSYVKSLPATILMCGLGQAMASLMSKDDGNLASAHGRLYADMQQWLCGQEGTFPGQKNLMDALAGSDMDTYLRAQAEALAVLVWLKKFATAFLKKRTDGTHD